MIDFKTTKLKNKNITIVVLVVFSILLFVSIAGIFNRIAQGEREIAEYIPNIVLSPISIFFVIRSILVLNGKIKPLHIPWMLVRDIGVLVFFIYLFYVEGSVFVDSLLKRDIVGVGSSVLLFAINIVGLYLWWDKFKTHWSLFSLVFMNRKNEEESITLFINNLMNSVVVYYVTDISVDSNLPYVGKDGLIYIYDSVELAEKVVNPLGFRGNIPSYIFKAIYKKERKDWFQNIYDMGFQSIHYVTKMGIAVLSLEDFGLNKTSDPIHNHSDQYLAQSYIAKQYSARYANLNKHLKKIGYSEEECSTVRSLEKRQRNIMVHTFYDSLFYTFVVPDTIDADNVLRYSKNAFEICTANDYIKDMSFENLNRNMVYPEHMISPYVDTNNKGEMFIIAYTKYKDAKAYYDEAKDCLEHWEADTSEEKKMNFIHYWNRLKGFLSCNICVMTGKEMAEFMINFKSVDAVINFSDEISLGTIQDYISENEALL